MILNRFSSPRLRSCAALSLSLVLVSSVTLTTIARAQDQGTVTNQQVGGPIRKGDVINIIVAGEAALTNSQKVAPDGTVMLPLVGSLKVIGLQPAQAAEQIAALYKKKNLLKNPQVIVVIAARPLQTVFISGALTRQGRVPLEEGMRLNEILEPAGILQGANLTNVSIQRGEQKIIVNYSVYRAGNDVLNSPNNPLLEDGDKIFVQAQIQVAGSVKISGEVRNPQLTSLPQGTTVMQAIQLAGGPTEFADRDEVVLLRGGQQILVPYKEISEGDRSKDIVLQDKDEIFVRRQIKKIAKVSGEVRMPQQVTLTTGLTASQAIQMAGGITENADRKQVLVFRDGKQLIVPFKEIQEGDRSGDIVLQDKDEIMVKRRESTGSFSVNGGVTRSGSYSLSQKTTLADAIAGAGGLLNNVNRKKITIRRKTPTGNLIDTNYDLNKQGSAEIVDGDIIEVGYPTTPSTLMTILPVITGIATAFYFLKR